MKIEFLKIKERPRISAFFFVSKLDLSCLVSSKPIPKDLVDLHQLQLTDLLEADPHLYLVKSLELDDFPALLLGELDFLIQDLPHPLAL